MNLKNFFKKEERNDKKRPAEGIPIEGMENDEEFNGNPEHFFDLTPFLEKEAREGRLKEKK